MGFQAKINGGTQVQLEEVQGVLARAGFKDCDCTSDLRAQGEGIGMILLQIPLDVFLTTLLQPIATGARDRLLRLFQDLRRARDEDLATHGQLYIRPGAVSEEEWEARNRQGPMPGFRKEGDRQPEIMIDSLHLDEAAIDALFGVDFSEVEGLSFQWDAERGEWRDPHADHRGG